eukprot:8757968-Pyramimonas_sp.AAC.1
MSLRVQHITQELQTLRAQAAAAGGQQASSSSQGAAPTSRRRRSNADRRSANRSARPERPEPRAAAP